MRLSEIIKRPLTTEKTTALTENGQYVFEVNDSATKNSVKKAINSLFGVDVVSVRTNIVPGKMKRLLKGRTQTKLPKWKKAVVTLKKGQKIEIFEIKEK